MVDQPRTPPPTQADLDALRPRGVCGYADLLLSYASGGLAEMTALAELLGYQRGPRRTESAPKAQVTEIEPRGASDGPPVFSKQASADIHYWQPDQRRFFQPLTLTPTEPDHVEPWQGLPTDRASIRDLAPWNDIASRIRTPFTTPADTASLDIDAIIRRLARGESLHRMPRRQRPRWGERVQIILDRSTRLTPFYEDQRRVEHRLTRLFPRHAVEFAYLPRDEDKLFINPERGPLAPYRIPNPDTLVIVLGDLGCLAADPKGASRDWADLGWRLVQAGCRPAALNPCPPSRWLDGPLRAWRMVPWDRRPSPGAYKPEQLVARADKLLRLVSPSVRFEPGLLRDVRLLLGAEADAGTEADVWQRVELIRRSPEAAMLDPEARRRLAEEFAQVVDPALRLEVIKRLRAWRGGKLYGDVPFNDIWFEEFDSLDPATRDMLPPAIRDGDERAAEQYWRTLAQVFDNHPLARAWYRNLSARVPADFFQRGGLPVQAVKQQLFLRAHEGLPQMPASPAGFMPGLDGSPDKPARRVDLRQVGGRAIAVPAATGSIEGSLLVSLLAAANEIVIVPAGGFWASGAAPSWADDWGYDAHGPWVAFSVIGAGFARVTQRMRWIRPGHFQMGSPKNEVGRSEWEGPRLR
jgi:hypothetical protein